jgi:hypothetical protein
MIDRRRLLLGLIGLPRGAVTGSCAELLLEVLATIRREPNVWLDETAKI